MMSQKQECNTRGLYDLSLGESMCFVKGVEALRVPGGWIFITYLTENPAICFVPFDNEFVVMERIID